MIVFLSNYYNHHQKAFSDDMYRLTDGQYRFIETKSMDDERVRMGWENKSAEYILQYQQYPDNCQKIIDEADVVIYGSAPYSMIANRLSKQKITFVYSERLFKNFHICVLRAVVLQFFRYKNKENLFLLCASAFAARDYSHLGLFQSKAYKWGYFPETKKYDDIKKMIDLKNPSSILWVARLIEWKHPELPVRVAKRLKSDGYQFQLNLIGNGELEKKIKRMIESENLSDCVHMLGAMKPNQVREYMEQTEIFLFTSDRNEGWGAVLNESMNSGCAVVANNRIGSVPYLIKNGINGLMYEDGNCEQLYAQTKKLLLDTEMRKKLGVAAYSTIVETWNSEEAATRLLSLLDNSDTYKISDFQDGPCSLA